MASSSTHLEPRAAKRSVKRPDASEVGAGVLNIPLVDRDGDILLLSDAVGPGRLVHEHLIVLPGGHLSSLSSRMGMRTDCSKSAWL